METRVVGIDLGVTAAHKAVVLDPGSGEYVGRPWSFHSWAPELDALLDRARQGCDSEPEIVVVLEATGMAWLAVGGYLHEQGARVYRVHGGKTRALRQFYRRHVSSDRIDCRVLAQLYGVAQERLVQWYPPTGTQLMLQRVCRESERLRRQMVAIENRLQSYDQWAWGGLKGVVPTVALEWMRRNWYDPWRVQAAGITALTAAWQATHADRELDCEWIASWVQQAECITQLYRDPKWVGYDALTVSIRHELDLLSHCQVTQEKLRRTWIRPLYRQLYPECSLESLYGVGVDSAALYMAFIMDIARFGSAAQFRNWCGIVPGGHQSGGQESKGVHITQAGPSLVKATLYLNANVARQWDVQFAKIYHHQMVDLGKHHKQAVCACASHLATLIYTVLKEKRPYELRDLEDNPISKAQSRELCQQYRVPQEVRNRKAARTRRARRDRWVEQHFKA